MFHTSRSSDLSHSVIQDSCLFRTSYSGFRASLATLVFFIAFSPLPGCGDGKSTVNGTVTFEGEPVKNGTITFIKAEGDLVREGGVIQNGEFQAALSPGKYKIELNAQKVIGKRKQKGFDGAEEEVELTEELFPPRYNEKTELIEEIKPGSNTLKLEARSVK